MSHVFAVREPGEERDNLQNPSVDLVRAITGSDGLPYTPKVISERAAISGVVAVYACVRGIAETIAALPFLLYDSGPDRARVPDGHPLARMLHRAPNPELTALEHWETTLGHALLWGDAYGTIVRDGAGRAEEVWPLRPDAMHVVWVDAGGQLVRDLDPSRIAGARRRHVYQLPSGEFRALQRRDVFHLRGFGVDAGTGLSPIRVARLALGIDAAAGEFAGRFFGQGALPGGLLTSPGNLDPDAVNLLREQWNKLHSGLERSHRVAVLTGGVDWKQVGMPLKDAQFVETRLYELREIARLYRYPLHKLNDLERATFSNIEHQSIEFLTDTLLPWIRRLEGAVARDLGDPEASPPVSLYDRGFTPEILVDGVLRGDAKSRAEAYAIAIQNGWMTRNEARRFENLAPIDGLDAPLTPLNMVAAGEDARRRPKDAV